MAADPIPGASLFSGPDFNEVKSWSVDSKRTTQMFLTTEYIVAGDNRMQETDQLQVEEEAFQQTVNRTNDKGEIVDFTRIYQKQTTSLSGQPAAPGPLNGVTIAITPESDTEKLKAWRNDDAEKKAVNLQTNLKAKLLDEDQDLSGKVFRTLENLFSGKEIKQGDTFDVPDKSVISLLDFKDNAASMVPDKTDIKVTLVKYTDKEAHLSYSGTISLVIGSALDRNGSLNFELQIENWVSVYQRKPFFELKREVKGAVQLNSIREIGDAIITTSGNGSLSEVRTSTL
jgi:hypothetical protein